MKPMIRRRPMNRNGNPFIMTLFISALFVLSAFSGLAPSLCAREAIEGLPQPAVLAAQQASEHAGEGAAEDSPAEAAESLKEIRESLRLLRKRQADMGADMTNLADEVRKLRGELEEMRIKDSQTRPEDPAARMKKAETPAGEGKPPAKDAKRDATQAAAPVAAQEGKPDLKELYRAAFNDFKTGNYDGGRRKFQAFLKQYPDASLASGAQFWIGESYYMEGNFEKAILEYDKVLLNHPRGEMVPHALLKQGLSFLKIGDKTAARIVLEKLSGDYPDTHQANIAKSTLATLK